MRNSAVKIHSSQAACVDILPCSLHSNRMQTLPVFLLKSCLWHALIPSVITLSSCLLQSLLMQRAGVCFIFRWRCVLGQENLPFSTGTMCVLQIMSHHSQASALSLCCFSVLVVIACGTANSGAFVHVVQFTGEKFSYRCTVLFQVTVLKTALLLQCF